MKSILIITFFFFSCSIGLASVIHCTELDNSNGFFIEVLIKSPTSNQISSDSAVYIGTKLRPVKENHLFRFIKDDQTLTLVENKLIGTVDFRFLDQTREEIFLGQSSRNLVMVIFDLKGFSPELNFKIEFVFKNGKRIVSEFQCR